MNPAITNHQGQAANVQKQNPRMGGCRLQACLRASLLSPEQLKSALLTASPVQKPPLIYLKQTASSGYVWYWGKLPNKEEVGHNQFAVYDI